MALEASFLRVRVILLILLQYKTYITVHTIVCHIRLWLHDVIFLCKIVKTQYHANEPTCTLLQYSWTALTATHVAGDIYIICSKFVYLLPVFQFWRVCWTVWTTESWNAKSRRRDKLQLSQKKGSHYYFIVLHYYFIIRKSFFCWELKDEILIFCQQVP